jgi:hypothetical protein
MSILVAGEWREDRFKELNYAIALEEQRELGIKQKPPSQ